MNFLKYALAIVMSLIALLFSWIPVYFINLVIALPAGLIAFFLWRSCAKDLQGRWYVRVPLYIIMISALALIGSYLMAL